MPERTIGLDLGVNSIGWVLLEHTETNMEDDPEGERGTGCIIAGGVRIFQQAVEDKTQTPKNFARRMKRGARKTISRRRQRRDKLQGCLQRGGLLPLDRGELNCLLTDGVANPYELRAKGLDDPLTPFEFGRSLFHLNRRRGFLSNRKMGKSDADAKKEEGKVKEAISQLQKAIVTSGARTLGEYLFCQSSQRGIHTSRLMYLDEFNLLWKRQHAAHPDLLTPALYDQCRHSIFDQRPLKIQKYLVGGCEFEAGKKRCAKGTLYAQQFRIWQDLNNLKVRNPKTYDLRPLRMDEKELLAVKLEHQKTLEWNAARRLLGLKDSELFNLEEGKKKGLLGNRTACDLRNVLGASWDTLSPQLKDQLVEDLLTIAEDDGLVKRLSDHWKFSEAVIAKLTAITLEDKVFHLSSRAIKKILPHLKRGLRYDEACIEAGYHHSKKPVRAASNELPPPPDLRNPVVNKALWEVRKLINAIVREYGKPDVIRVEMARDMKLSKAAKDEVQKEQKKREKENLQFKEWLISEFGIRNPSGDDIVKYRLWAELDNQLCPYTGTPIARSQLFTSDVDVEHILPYSLSLDDSYMNKTLCMATENRLVKRNRTPYEAYGETDRWEGILQRIKKFPFGKRQRFAMKEVKLDDFVQRQLNDTRYISCEVTDYLSYLGVKVQVTKGGATAALRKKWQLNRILGAVDEEKCRTDHRHHAVDAAVIACTTPGLLRQMSSLSARWQTGVGAWDRRLNVLPPWRSFWSDVNEMIGGIVVSHSPVHKLSGAFHEETVYGYAGEGEKKGYALLVRRVQLETITPKQIERIRDEEVRRVVSEQLPTEKNARMNARLSLDGGKTFIKSVRVLEPVSLASCFGLGGDGEVKEKYFKYGSNHHVEVVRHKNTGKLEGRFVTMLEAARRARIAKIPIVQRDHGPEYEFVMWLSTNDMVEVTEDEKKKLYRVQKMTASGTGVITLRSHTAATLSDDAEVCYIVPSGIVKCRKFSVDPIGRVSEAND